MAITDATAETFKGLVLDSERPVLVDFWATWCGPCKIMHPILQELGEGDYPFDVVKVDVDESPALGNLYDVKSIPTMVLFIDGKPHGSIVGAQPRVRVVNTVKELIDEHQR